MKRSYLYCSIAILTYLISAWIIGYHFTLGITGGLCCALPCIVLGLLIGAAVDGYISSKYPNALYTPYKDKRILALSRQKKREDLQETMLLKMQYMQGLEQTIAELNEIFMSHRELKLTRWIVFRAWYKAQIDHMLQHPDIYRLSVKGDPYNKEEDPLYDPSAPDWSIYDREHYYDDDEEDDDNDWNDDKKDEISDALAVGLGIGIANCMTGDSA